MSHLARRMSPLQQYAETACVETGVDQRYQPTHTVQLRLDERTDYVHAYSILQALSPALRKPDTTPVSLDRLQIRERITRDLFLSAGDTPHQTSYPGVKPALEVAVSYDNGAQRVIYGYQFGPKITNRNDDPIGFLEGDNFPTSPELVDETIEAMGWRKNPGIFIANWLQTAAHSAGSPDTIQRMRSFPLSLWSYRPLIHSAKGFQLPSYADGASYGVANYVTKVTDVRPLASLPNSRFLGTKVDIVKANKRIGGGKINFAILPADMF